MRVAETRQESELQEWREAWSTLLRDCGCDTVFLTWEWVSAWWAAYGRPGELRILTAFDEDGALRGIAPLRSQTVRKYGRTVSALSFVGDGSNDADYLDFPIARGYEQPVMEAFTRHLLLTRNDPVLLLNEIPATSPSLPLLKCQAELRNFIWTETDVPCGTVPLPKTWDEYLGMLRPRFRTKVRSVLRAIEGRPEFTFGFCETPEQIRELLPVLFDLHGRRWAEDGKPGVFGWDRKREFYANLSALLLDRGWLRFSWLAWNGRILACQYGFTYAGKYFQLQEGYEPASDHWNVGIGLRAWSIREFVKEGIGEYDFLGGVGRHKTDWGCQVKQSKRIQLAADTWKNRLFCLGPEWEFRARETAIRMIPERVLAAIRARRRSREDTQRASAGEWARKTAANVYFHSGLFGLARRLREQYQLSISPNGGARKVAWTRRTETAGRILYYHRVNDDNDPFFPAISTELFEQQMRYVARNYKVVSLAELLKQLEGGAPRNLVSITFDDGYQDNYHNAFPILQRYGLPATIFLTTGGMDSREPLWFEQVALAFKKTEAACLDLEIEIPRRFWLSTQEERLKANGEVFGILRKLPDAERRESVQAILGRLGLGAADLEERSGKMLTWEQVRLMKAQGIDFGGHTVTHPFLSKLTRERGAWEVAECKRRIEEELQLPVEHFAYPNGREEDFGNWNKEVIRAAGYRAAVTTIWGMNYRSTDRMELRRGQPWEVSRTLFAYKLDWYQLVND
jgi:peptidoglycan/xylan/chitin deacetylase (PgdA/CDA1 family)/CelD/BcsL family acetyltransferase involved in cellulose biosynthesis